VSPRELGCRTVGCGLAFLFVMMFFGYLLNVSDTTLRAAAEKRKAADAKFDLPLLYQGIAQYAEAHEGALPPMESPAALKAALHPTYVSNEAIFLNLRDKEPYLVNPHLSGKPLNEPGEEWKPDQTVLVAEATADEKTKVRRAVLLDGSFREVPEGEWDALAKASKLR
jgi:hypothetical protein